LSFWSGLRGLGRNRHYNRGIVHYNRGEYEEAAAAFEKALESIGDVEDPDFSLGAFYAAEARTNLALACLHAGDLGAAERHLRRAIERNPDYADLRVHLATVLERRGHLEGARDECLVALEQNPQYIGARLLLAVCAARLGEAGAAREALKSVVAQGYELPAGVVVEPWNGLSEEACEELRQVGGRRSQVQFHVEQGLERYTQGKLEEALAEFETAIAAEPAFPDIRAKRAALLAETHRHGEAVDEWHRALELNPDYQEARVRLGVSLLALGRTREAVEAFDRALERSPDDPELLHLAGAAWLCDGSTTEAETHLKRAARSERRGGRARRLLGLCALAERNDAEAERQWKQGVSRNGSIEEWFDLAWLATRRGDAERAVRTFRTALGKFPDRSELHYGLGLALLQKGRDEHAERSFSRAIELSGERVSEAALAQLGRARARLRREEWEPAREDLESAVHQLGSSPEAWLLLARARRGGGDTKGAGEAFEQAIKLNPGSVDALAEHAGFLTETGENGDAFEAWSRVRRLDPLHPLARAHGGELVRDAVARVYGG
jgi:tetratricopeptide (TPR) repeat protein